MDFIHPKIIVLSRTDSIGDVALTLPLAGILKKEFPSVKIIFLGNSYTEPVISCSRFVDEVWKWDDLSKMPKADSAKWLREKQVDVFIHVFPRKEIARWARSAGVPHRIGTSHRLFHLLTCNHRPNFTRKNSDLHEAQLNTKLLAPLGITRNFELETLYGFAGFGILPSLPASLNELCVAGKKTVILHPKSKGSAVEWDVANFIQLAESLDPTKYTILFTGTTQEGDLFRDQIPVKPNIFDLTGKMTLKELIAVISKSHCLVAASTGPLHIAGLCGIRTIGLYSSRRPIHPGRWSPLGISIIVFEDKNNSGLNQPLQFDLRDILRQVEQVESL